MEILNWITNDFVVENINSNTIYIKWLHQALLVLVAIRRLIYSLPFVLVSRNMRFGPRFCLSVEVTLRIKREFLLLNLKI